MSDRELYELRKALLQERAIHDGRVWEQRTDGTWVQLDKAHAWAMTEAEMRALIRVRALPMGQRCWVEHRGPCPDSCNCGGINSPSRWIVSFSFGPAGDVRNTVMPGMYSDQEMLAIVEARKVDGVLRQLRQADAESIARTGHPVQ